MLNEKEYRQRIAETFSRIEQAFENVDPDRVECTQSQGALTLLAANGAKCILSAQPSVRQLWMAVAARGVAFHFDWNAEQAQWLDDKGRGIELWSYLRQYVKETAGVELS
jgi:CyaY protein